jgi:hypothetical protein
VRIEVPRELAPGKIRVVDPGLARAASPEHNPLSAAPPLQQVAR